MEFKELKVSTQTIIANTNWLIDIEKLFNKLTITPYVYIPAPRKNPKIKVNNNKIDYNLNKLQSGSIIMLKYKGQTRGVDIKQMKKNYSHRVSKKPQEQSEKKPFRNCMTVVMKVRDKKLTFKLPSHGGVQICGCKTQEHADLCIKYMWKHIHNINKTDKTIVVTLEKYPRFTTSKPDLNEILKKQSEKSDNDEEISLYEYPPKILLKTVMINKDFKLGFTLDREKLNIFINKYTECKSLLETSVNTSVIVKIPSIQSNRPSLLEYVLTNNKWIKQYMVYSDYVKQLNNNEAKKEMKKRFHSFLMFHSGAIILSSPYLSEMELVYNSFIGYIRRNKEQVEEKLITDNNMPSIDTLFI